MWGERIVAVVTFDLDDIVAAFAELDARYLAGEAAPFANTWSALAGFYAALNRHKILATPDWVNVDHRRATTVAPGDMAASIHATWDLAPNITRSIEAVHRLDNLGAVVAHTAYGTSREGFDAEWRLVGSDVRVIVALGGFAWRAALEMIGAVVSPVPKFGHGATAVAGEVTLIGCYHPSQQNTFTGKLTPAMLDDIFGDAKKMAELSR